MLQRVALIRGACAGRPVDDTKRADVIPVAGPHRRPGIKANARLSEHQRVSRESLIGERILHHQRVAFENGMGAKRVASVALTKVQAEGRFRPLSMRGNEVQKRDRRFKELSRHRHQAVEHILPWRIEHLKPMQRPEPAGLVNRRRRLLAEQGFGHHRIDPGKEDSENPGAQPRPARPVA